MSISIKTLPTLYKRSTKDQLIKWVCFYDVDKGSYWYEYGQTKLVTTKPTFVKPKNIGKANETTLEEQLLKTVNSIFQKKLDEGYSLDPENIDVSFSPMLAQEFDEKRLDWSNKKYYVQPKLDGIRCIRKNQTSYSRNGKPFYVTDHIHEPEVMFDGELYNHDLKDDFNKIVSLVKKKTFSSEEKYEIENTIQYHVYDCPDIEGSFEERFNYLYEYFQSHDVKNCVLVPTFLVTDVEDIKRMHDRFLEQGYEGTIIRESSKNYEQTRTYQLMKYKNWMDSEFTIIDVIEGTGNRSGTVGKVVVKINEKLTCESNVKADFKTLTDIWNNKEDYIGKSCTIKFFGYTPAGRLRFPYVIAFKREDYE